MLSAWSPACGNSWIFPGTSRLGDIISSLGGACVFNRIAPQRAQESSQLSAKDAR